VKSNKLTSLILLFVILFSFCLASCSSGTTTANSMPATSVIELFEKAGKVFAELDSTDVISVTVTVRNIEQVTSSKITYWNNDYGFAITLPKSWKVSRFTNKNGKATLLPPLLLRNRQKMVPYSFFAILSGRLANLIRIFP